MDLRIPAALGAAVYLLTLIAVPVANLDLDVVRLHPEDYANASLGWLVVAGWLALAVSLAAIALATARAGVAPKIAAIFFALAALVCVANAIDPTLGARRSPIELGVFGLVIGPLVASFAWRGMLLRVIAVAAAVAFAGLLFGGDAIGGIVNRVFDALAAVWCIAFAARSRHAKAG